MMNSFKFLFSLSLLVIIAFGTLNFRALAQEYSFIINDVDFVGNQRVDSEALKMQLKYKQGQVSAAQISEEVKSLYRTGFFDQVTASVANTAAGAVLRYRLVEKPIIRKVFVKGNQEISEDTLQEALTVSTQRFLDQAQINDMTEKATALYKSKGYHDVSLEHSVAQVGDNQVDLTFAVNEGPRYQISEVKFEGLNEVDEAELVSLMQTRSYKWWSSWLFGTGRLNEDMLEADRSQIKQFLLDRGYVDSVVNQPSIVKKDQEFDVVFRIVEGPVYKFGKVSFSGDKLESDLEAEPIEEVINAESGEDFSAKTLREDSFSLGDLYGNYGYAFANVVPDTNVKKASKEVDVNYTVSKGRSVQINKVKISGNSKTYDNVIRRELRVDEGELYSGKKLRRTQEVLQRRGYFDEVTVGTESVSDDKVDVNVNVKEGQTGTFSAGAGYSTYDGLLFNARVSENNIFGTGRKLSLNADVGTERSNYVLGLEDPRLSDTHMSGATSLFSTSRVFDDYDRDLTGANVSFGYPLEQVFDEWAEDIGVGLKYELMNIDITDVEEDSADLVLASEGKSDASAITPRIFRNTINNPLNPTKGSRQEASVELAGFGGDQEFYLYELKNTFYYPLIETESGDITLSMRTNYAVGEPQGDDEFLPLYRRMYAGGINSVRGYDDRTITPKDDRGNEYGGAKEFVHNTEMIFPLVNSAGIRGLFFYDVGNVADDNESIDFADLKDSYGFGIRWNSPLGPLRLEFGFPLSAEDDEDDGMQTHFSFGAPF
jgi:outer membrane protein insertion porin family